MHSSNMTTIYAETLMNCQLLIKTSLKLCHLNKPQWIMTEHVKQLGLLEARIDGLV